MKKILPPKKDFLHPIVEVTAMSLYQALENLYHRHIPPSENLPFDDEELPDDPKMLQRLKERKLNRRDFQYQSHMELEHKPYLGIV